ncbi:hypothetical protein V8C37DRAFT_385173 [Trichoderma ceciliae]
MVLLEHLPLFGLALSLAHHNNGRASHDSPSLLNHRPVPQISDDLSQFHQAPNMIAARTSDDSHDTTIQVSQNHLQNILDRIKSLEEEIFDMVSKADSSLDLFSTPAKYASQDPDDVEFSKAALAALKPEKLVVTTRREPKAAPATIIGGLFKEASVDLNGSAVFDQRSTTIVTSTTRITRTVTIVPTRIFTLTTFPTNLAKESNSKALIPFFDGTATAIPPRTTLRDDGTVHVEHFSPSSADIAAELRRPKTTPLGFNSSTTFHHVSLSAIPSGFRTIRRAA